MQNNYDLFITSYYKAKIFYSYRTNASFFFKILLGKFRVGGSIDSQCLHSIHTTIKIFLRFTRTIYNCHVNYVRH
jgi:hypothetical protein